MRVIISGASGLVGTAVSERLRAGGHEVARMVRGGSPPRHGEVPWDPQEGLLDPAWLSGADAVVHLAGENIAGRWNAAKKARIRDSRVRGTSLVAKAICDCPRPPRVLFCASAIGYYGDRGSEELTEDSSPGTGILAEVCRAWEEAAAPVVGKGTRLILGRFGVILSPRGGALARMLTPFKLGLGGVMGSGRQMMSWIALDDVVAGIEFCLGRDEVSGPINFVSPKPMTNRQFTHALGEAVRRPTFLPMPAPLARLAFGEMADHLLLSSASVKPQRLMAAGFRFHWPELAPALKHMLAPTERVG